MPWDRRLYPDDWQAVADAIKREVDYVCERCGLQCRRPGEPFDTHRRTMSVAHFPDPTPTNTDRSNLQGLCSACHLQLDAPMHARHARYGRRSTDPTYQPPLFEGLHPYRP